MIGRTAETEGAAHSRRPSVARIVSPVLFAAILIAFALPFGTVSCDGPPVHFTGYQLATSNVPEPNPPATTDDGASLPDTIESKGSGLAFVAFAAAVAGLVLGLAGRRGGGIATLAGLFGSAGLLGVAATEFGVVIEAGFWIVAALYLILAVWHAALAIRRRRSRLSRSEVPLLPPGALPRL